MQRDQQHIYVGPRLSLLRAEKPRISWAGWLIDQGNHVAVVALLVAGAVWAGLGWPARVAAQADYAVESDAWNSLSELLRLGRVSGLPITAASQLNLADLTPRDGLLIVFPEDEPPA